MQLFKIETENIRRSDIPVADNFIDIHVALSSRAGLPDDQWEVLIQFTIVNLVEQKG